MTIDIMLNLHLREFLTITSFQYIFSLLNCLVFFPLLHCLIPLPLLLVKAILRPYSAHG